MKIHHLFTMLGILTILIVTDLAVQTVGLPVCPVVDNNLIPWEAAGTVGLITVCLFLFGRWSVKK